ncbi:F-box/kelch-repeat protein [Ananas comosus]|uniref:F-box/kelch-repeat protein n=1 Tax=Ananas comosus TaxID=4615 RepID=A0A199VNV9_ANACO|nr:F-box/kelch-repeat protein [Ananas comosus]
MGSRVKAEAEAEAEEEEKFDSSRDPRVLYLYGDVLEAVASRVPTLDLVSASRVSREWRRGVRAALRRRPRRSPWLLLRLHRPTSTSASASSRGTLLAYDPHSRTWLPPLPHVRGPPRPRTSPPRASPALHAASLSAMAVARDPFGATWRAVEARACEGEDAGAVEVRGPGGSDGWEPCDPIPAAFDGSKSATWLSAATSDSRVYITDKNRGWTSWFDLETKKWGPTRQLRPDPAAASFAIGILSSGYNNNNNNDDDRHRHRLVLATAGRREGRVEVRLWEADAETLDVVEGKCAAAEMPKEFAKRMFQDITEEESDEDDRSWGSSSLSVGLCSSGDGGYVYNGSDLRKGMVRFYDYYYYYHDEDGRTASCKWEWIGVPMIMQKEKVVDRVVVVGCTVVGLDDLALLFPY